MRRFEALKRLDKKSRNKLRAILSNDDVNAIDGLAQLRGKLRRTYRNQQGFHGARRASFGHTQEFASVVSAQPRLGVLLDADTK